MFQGYVINLDRRTDRLFQFYQQKDAHYFQRVAAVDKHILALLGDASYIFNTESSYQSLERAVTLGEIGCTLSHIKAWKLIAENNQLSDDDFAIVAEDDVKFVANFSDYLTYFLPYFHKSQADIVLLQRIKFSNDDKITQFEGGELRCFIPKSAKNDCAGSSLYLIRKSKTKSLIKRLETEKPSWLADQFSLFCDLDKMIILLSTLGYVENLEDSDLEYDRGMARQEALK